MGVIHDRYEQGVRVTWIHTGKTKGNYSRTNPKTGNQRRRPDDHLGFLLQRSEVDLISTWRLPTTVWAEPAKNGGEILGYLCIVRDPDGNLVEFSYGQAKAPCDRCTHCFFFSVIQ